MANPYSVLLQELIDEYSLEIIYKPDDMEQIRVQSADLNRLGLQLVGYFDYTDPLRIHILGKVEYTFLESYDGEKAVSVFDRLFAMNIPALIVTRGLPVREEIIQSARKHSVPILRTAETSSDFMANLIGYLNVQLAPRVTLHGVMVEVYGEGILLLGESGVGKSETALELVKRGHRLIADDAVEIKRVSAITLVGSAPPAIRHFIELRGVGIIDVRRIFGMGAVKMTEKVDMIIEIEMWEEDINYERIGLETSYKNILGLDIPSLKIPVKPGRNLAVIIEVAAMNNRQKKLGYNAAAALFEGINLKEDAKSTRPKP